MSMSDSPLTDSMRRYLAAENGRKSALARQAMLAEGLKPRNHFTPSSARQASLARWSKPGAREAASQAMTRRNMAKGREARMERAIGMAKPGGC